MDSQSLAKAHAAANLANQAMPMSLVGSMAANLSGNLMPNVLTAANALTAGMMGIPQLPGVPSATTAIPAVFTTEPKQDRNRNPTASGSSGSGRAVARVCAKCDTLIRHPAHFCRHLSNCYDLPLFQCSCHITFYREDTAKRHAKHLNRAANKNVPEAEQTEPHQISRHPLYTQHKMMIRQLSKQQQARQKNAPPIVVPTDSKTVKPTSFMDLIKADTGVSNAPRTDYPATSALAEHINDTATLSTNNLKASEHAWVYTLSAAQQRDAPSLQVEDNSSLMDGGLLQSWIYPCTVPQFFRDIWKQRAFVVNNGGTARVAYLISNYMFNLDLDTLLSETASEQIFVWMKAKAEEKSSGTVVSTRPKRGRKPVGDAHAEHIRHAVSTGDSSNAADGISSFELDSSNPGALQAAKICYDAGASLYFRSSPEMAQVFVTAMTRAVGLDFAGFYPNGDVKGEIEVFLSRAGHVVCGLAHVLMVCVALRYLCSHWLVHSSVVLILLSVVVCRPTGTSISWRT